MPLFNRSLLRHGIQILRHPLRGWRDTDALRAIPPDTLVRTILILAFIPAASGLIATLLFGVAIPVWGRWRMQFSDAIAYYLVFYSWLAGHVFIFCWTLVELSSEFEKKLDPQAALLLGSAILLPIACAGLAPLFPFEALQTILAIGMLYGIVIFYGGLRRLMPGVRNARETVFVRALGVNLLVCVVTLMAIHLLIFPSYSPFSVTSPPVSREVADLLKNMEKLAEMNQ